MKQAYRTNVTDLLRNPYSGALVDFCVDNGVDDNATMDYACYQIYRFNVLGLYTKLMSTSCSKVAAVLPSAAMK